MPPSRPFTAEAYVTLQLPDHPAATPDGAACAFVVKEADLEESRVVSHLWLADSEASEDEEPRQITFSHEGEDAPAFSPDGAWLAFLSARPDFSRPEPELEGDEEPKTQLWVLPALGGEARCLTDAREGVMTYDWLPDGSGLVYLAAEPRPKALQAHHSNKVNFKDDAVVEHEDRRRIGVWRVEVGEDGENKRLWEGDFGGMDVRISPDGKRAVYVTNGTGDPNDYIKTDFLLLELETGETRPFSSRSGPKWSPQWSPEGDRIAFLSGIDPEVSYSQSQLWIVSSEGGEPSRLLPELDREIESYAWPRRCPEEIFFTAAEGLGNRMYRLNLPDGSVDALTDEGVLVDFDVSDEGDTAYLIWENGETWPELYHLRLKETEEIEGEDAEENDSASETETESHPAEPMPDEADPSPVPREGVEGEGSLTRLTDLNPDWKEVELAPQRSFKWQSDGLEIEGLLALPPGAGEGKPLPLVAYIHGGPHGYTKNNLRQGVPLQWLTRLGCAVLAPNFRGSSSGDAAFAVANRHDLGGGDYRDVMAGIDATVAAGIADPDRLAIMGGSYGGYMTNWAISQTDRFRAAVSLFGIFNWITDYSNSEISHFEKEYFGHYYWEDPTLYLERSPFRYVDRIRTPVLILHGEDDPNTFISNSMEMYRALRALGRTVSFVRYPREGHGFHEPRHRVDVMNRVAAWLEAHLLGEGPETPVAYRMDQEVKGEGGWTLRVTSADEVKPVGHKEPEETALVNVVFVLASREKEAEIELRLEDLRAEAGGQPCPLLGVPVKTLDETILTGGEGLRVRFKGEEPPSAFPVAGVFRVPKGPGEMSLTVPGFPPVRLPLPKPDSEDEETPPEGPEHTPEHFGEGAGVSHPQPGPVQK